MYNIRNSIRAQAPRRTAVVHPRWLVEACTLRFRRNLWHVCVPHEQEPRAAVGVRTGWAYSKATGRVHLLVAPMTSMVASMVASVVVASVLATPEYATDEPANDTAGDPSSERIASIGCRGVDWLHHRRRWRRIVGATTHGCPYWHRNWRSGVHGCAHGCVVATVSCLVASPAAKAAAEDEAEQEENATTALLGDFRCDLKPVTRERCVSAKAPAAAHNRACRARRRETRSAESYCAVARA